MESALLLRVPAVAAVLALLVAPHLDTGDPEAYRAGGDVRTLSEDGSAVGPLERLRVQGKYTVFDVYADWCAPCRLVDRRLRAVVARRGDVAVRKLNVVDFDTPLARELGDAFEALPYLVVFSPDGKRSEIVGTDFDALDEALRRPVTASPGAPEPGS